MVVRNPPLWIDRDRIEAPAEQMVPELDEGVRQQQVQVDEQCLGQLGPSRGEARDERGQLPQVVVLGAEPVRARGPHPLEQGIGERGRIAALDPGGPEAAPPIELPEARSRR